MFLKVVKIKSNKMENWKGRLPKLFPEIRAAFCLEEKAAVGASDYWHTDVATGIVIPIKGIIRQGHFLWQTPFEMTAGGRIDKYELAEEGEIIVYPEQSRILDEDLNVKPLAYLISIHPAPGLETAFKRINDEELTGLLAHELTEVDLASQQPNYHHRITHHGLPETEVDKMAAERGYGNQIHSYLQFLMRNVNKIRSREKVSSIFDEFVIGGATPEPPKDLVTQFCRSELQIRIDAIEGKSGFKDSNVAGYLTINK